MSKPIWADTEDFPTSDFLINHLKAHHKGSSPEWVVQMLLLSAATIASESGKFLFLLQRMEDVTASIIKVVAEDMVSDLMEGKSSEPKTHH